MMKKALQKAIEKGSKDNQKEIDKIVK